MDLQIQPPLPSKRDFRIGILGSGFVVNECHLPAYRKAGFNPVAIASRQRQNAEQTAQRHGIPTAYDSYDDLLNDPSIEVLDIAVPPQAQLDLIRRACARKTVRGILAQKPLGINYAEAVVAALACQQAGIVLSVNQNMRYDQSVRAAKTLLQNGVIGPPVFATIEMRGIPHWMPWQAELGWATLRTMSIHHLDCFRYWFGSPEGIYCSVRTDPRTPFPHKDGICTYILDYASGLRCVGIDDPWTGPAREGCPADIYLRWRIEGLNGLAIGDIGWCRDPFTTPSTIKYASKGDEGFHEPKWTESWFPDAFIGTMAQLLIALETGTEPAISAEDNLKTMALVEAAYTSAKRFTSINLGDFVAPRKIDATEVVREALRQETVANFTPRAQQALALARQEADRFNHNYVGTEHLLLGLIALGRGVSVTVLAKLGLDLKKVRAEVEKEVGRGPDQKVIGHIPYAPPVKEVLAHASQEAQKLDHAYVGTEHILLGLLKKQDEVAARILKNLGVDVEQTRLEILRELDPPLQKTPENVALTESEKSEFVSRLPFLSKRIEQASRRVREGKWGHSIQPLQVLALARMEADRCHHGFVSSEHLLLGILKLGVGPAFDLLAKSGLNWAKVRAEVEKEVGVCPDQKSPGNIPHAPRVRRILEAAAKEARNSPHACVTTEHILLALLNEGDGVVQIVLKNLGLDIEKTRAELLRLLDSANVIPPPTEGEKLSYFSYLYSKANPELNNFSPRAQQVLALARNEAYRFNHSFVGTEHLLLGLIKLGQGVAVNVLRNFRLDLQKVRAEVEKQIGSGPPGHIAYVPPFTPRVKKILVLASKEADHLNHKYVGTEHILLGLLLEEDSVAGRVLRNLNVDADKARQEILIELNPIFEGGAGNPAETASEKPGASIPPAAKETINVDLHQQEEGPTPLAQRVLRFAREEAERLKHPFIGPEHLLIGLIAVGQGIAFEVLHKRGVFLGEVREAVEKHVVVEPGQKRTGPLDYTRGKAVLALAIQEAKALNHYFVGTEHILLGLLRQEDGLVPQIWKDHGVDPAPARAEVLKEIERIFGK